MSAGKRHHTVRTVFGLCIFCSYLAVVACVAAGVVRDGILVTIGFLATLQSLLILYRERKGRGEEDIRSDESIL